MTGLAVSQMHLEFLENAHIVFAYGCFPNSIDCGTAVTVAVYGQESLRNEAVSNNVNLNKKTKVRFQRVA